MVARLRDGPYYLVDAIVRGDGTSQRGDAGTVTTLGVRARARFGTHEPEHAPHVLIESTVDGGSRGRSCSTSARSAIRK
jgi:hypothetical protein